MPPRYAYWTILVDDQPTAFRASAQEDLLPTLKRLQAKHPSAKMMWWQNGKLWERRVDAQDAMFTRGELGRRNDSRQSGGGFRGRERKPFGDRERKPFRDRGDGGKRSAWTPRGEPSAPAPTRNADDKLDWKPKGTFVPAPKRADRSERTEWTPKDKRSSGSRFPAAGSRDQKPEWRPKGSFDREERPSFKRPAYKPSGDDSRSSKPAWKPKGSFDRSAKPDWKPKGSFDRERKPGFSRPQDLKTSRPSGKLEWTPKSQASSPKPAEGEKRKWVPKEEYKKSMGIEAKRDAKWRPGGLHKDPKQKYKDAKKAKWTRFKKAIRTRAESKGKKNEE